MKFSFSTLVLMISACIPAIAQASPFLVCDPTTETIEYYVVSGLPTGMGAEKITPDVTKKYGFMLDLSTLPPGEYTIKAKACTGPWGCSADSLPFSFKRPAPSQSPLGIGLSQ
jgi:hypothetical protein